MRASRRVPPPRCRKASGPGTGHLQWVVSSDYLAPPSVVFRFTPAALGVVVPGLALVSLLGCSDAAVPTGSNLPHAAASLVPGTTDQPVGEEITLCKVGSGADFSVTSSYPAGTTTPHLSDGECIVVGLKSPTTHDLTASATETSADPGFYLDHIVVTTITDAQATPVKTTVTGTSTVSGSIAVTAGITWTYYNLPIPAEGCTFTIGYWKTHAGFGPQADVVTPLLPILLGNGGGKSIDVTSAALAVQLLSFRGSNNVFEGSNGINKLYAQLLGAKLSIANGVSGSAVASTITAADNFLTSHNSDDWSGLSKAEKAQVLGWMTTLDNFNNGLIGPAHCA
jgi:hypothetical protein